MRKLSRRDPGRGPASSLDRVWWFGSGQGAGTRRTGWSVPRNTLAGPSLRRSHFCKNPGFTAVAVLTLALGIGGTTAIFSVVYGALLNPLPYPDSDRLVVLFTHDLKNPRLDRWAFVSPDEFLDYQEQNRVFDQVFGGLGKEVLLTARDTTAKWWGLWTTPNMFQTFGIPPSIGRNIIDDDARPGAPPVVVLNYRTWQKTFGGDPGIIGQTLILNRQPTTVIGVMPPRFTFFGGEETRLLASHYVFEEG